MKSENNEHILLFDPARDTLLWFGESSLALISFCTSDQ